MSETTCFHCGLPVKETERFSVVIDGEPRPMCCPGCAAVAQMIAGSGLTGYYRHRSVPAMRPDDASADALEYAIFDEDDAQADFVASEPDGSCRAQLAIDGISCAACTWLIEHHLSTLPGVSQVGVNLAEHRASIVWEPAVTPLSRLMAAIREIGYRPRPYLPSDQLLSLKAESRGALRRLGLAGIVQMQIGMFAIALYAGAFQGIETEYRDYLRWASLLLCIPVVGYSAAPFFRGAWRGLRNRHPGMDLPVALAIGLAFAASVWFTLIGAGEVYFDSVAMFTFFLLLGRYLEMRARHDAGLASGNLLSLVPAAATRLAADGVHSELVPVSRLRTGDRLLVRPGEAFAADGRVVEGESSVDESSLSGESMPVSKRPDDEVSAGSLNVDGSLVVEVKATGLNSRLGAILSLVDRAQRERPMSVAIADRAASAFVVAVLLIAGCTALYWSVHAPARALEIVLSVLVVSCPCALSLAAPTAMTAATTALKRRGFLVTRGHALDSLAGADHIILDKTGTLTCGRVSLQEVRPLGDADAPDCLRIAASIESRSEHPIAAAFAQATDERLPVQAFRAVAGQGVEARIDSEIYRLGRSGFAQGGDTAAVAEPDDGKWVLLTRNDRPLAWFRLGDRLRDDAGRTVEELRALKLDIGLLSGDSHAEVARTARTLGIEQWQSDCSPETKLASMRTAQAQGHRLIMVGDGINDVPVLSGADVSIAMANASDVTRANADCVLIAVELDRIPESIRHARLARRVIRQNVVWAIVYNLTAVPFAAAGMVPPWLAAIGMSASSLVVVGNALRLRASRKVMETRSGSVWTASTF